MCVQQKQQEGTQAATIAELREQVEDLQGRLDTALEERGEFEQQVIALNESTARYKTELVRMQADTAGKNRASVEVLYYTTLHYIAVYQSSGAHRSIYWLHRVNVRARAGRTCQVGAHEAHHRTGDHTAAGARRARSECGHKRQSARREPSKSGELDDRGALEHHSLRFHISLYSHRFCRDQYIPPLLS